MDVHVKNDNSQYKNEIEKLSAENIGSVGANSTGSINKTKKPNQKFFDWHYMDPCHSDVRVFVLFGKD